MEETSGFVVTAPIHVNATLVEDWKYFIDIWWKKFNCSHKIHTTSSFELVIETQVFVGYILLVSMLTGLIALDWLRRHNVGLLAQWNPPFSPTLKKSIL